MSYLTPNTAALVSNTVPQYWEFSIFAGSHTLLLFLCISSHIQKCSNKESTCLIQNQAILWEWMKFQVMYIAVISTAMSRTPLPQPMGIVRPCHGPNTDSDGIQRPATTSHWKVV